MPTESSSVPDSRSTPSGAARGVGSFHPAYVFFTGLLMGAADVVPGVSGGTIALIMGIYEQLLDGIRSFNVLLLNDLRHGQVKAATRRIPWRMLLPLAAGITTSLVTFAHVIELLMERHESLLFAFFFGLVGGSAIVLIVHQRWSVRRIGYLAAGVLLAYWFVGLVPADPGHSRAILFASGSLAICAMILPGISGSFVLLVLGQYAYCVEALTSLTTAVRHADLLSSVEVMGRVVVPAALGAVAGLVVFSRVLGWLLHRFPAQTMALLTGLMIGSLRRIWPYKQYLQWGTDRHGNPVPLAWRNELPPSWDGQVALALLLAVTGLLLILAIDRLRHGMQCRSRS